MHFPSDGLIYHKDSPATDKTRLDIGTVFGGYYSAAISDNVKRRQQQKLADGEYPGKVHFGYKNITVGYNSRGDEINDVSVDEPRAGYVQRAFELRCEGLSVASITDILNKEGATSNTKNPKPLVKSFVDTMLKDKFYIGIMTWNGKEYRHKYPHLISDSLFNEVQSINDVRSRKKTQTKRQNGKEIYALSGIARCKHCGGAMSSYVKKGHVYLRCSKKENILLEQIMDILKRIEISQFMLEKASEAINKRHNEQHKSISEQAKLLRSESTRLTKQIEMAYEDRLNGSITVEKYNEIAKVKEQRVNEISEILGRMDKEDKDTRVDISYLLKLIEKLPKLFESSRNEVKNEILGIIFSNLEIDKKRVLPSLIEPFCTLYQRANKRKWLPGLDSNQ